MNALPSAMQGSPAGAEVSAPASHRGVRGWIARRPMTAFLLIAGALAYPLMGLTALAVHGVVPGGSLPGLLGMAPDEAAGGLLVWAGLVPAALLVTGATEGRAGIRRLAGRMFHWRVGLGWWLLALTGLPILTTGLAVLFGADLRPVDLVPFVAGQVVLLAVNFLATNLWEEAVWAGFLQTRWERRHSIVVATLLTAVVFAFGHVPLALFQDEITAASVGMSLLLYFVLGLLVRSLFAVVLRGTRDSLLLVALLHSVFNRTNNDDGIAATLAPGDARGIGMLLAVVVMTAAVAVVSRGRLGRAYRRELDRRPV